MKKFGLALAAVAAIAFVAPTLASAETTIIKKVYKSGTRAEMRDRGTHRGWRPHHRHADRVVIIKKRGHHHHW